MTRDKLAKEVARLTTKLESTQQQLEDKTRLLDQALKAQHIMDENLSKTYDIFNERSATQKAQEDEL